MSEWKKEEHTASDPLASSRGTPILGQQGSNAKFLGRVIVELWETESSKDDANNIAYSAEATDGDGNTLLKRVAVALSTRIQRQSP